MHILPFGLITSYLRGSFTTILNEEYIKEDSDGNVLTDIWDHDCHGPELALLADKLAGYSRLLTVAASGAP